VAAAVAALMAAGVVAWVVTTVNGGSGRGGGSRAGNTPSTTAALRNVVVLSTNDSSGQTPPHLIALDADTGKPITEVPKIPGSNPVLSPDGHWLVYTDSRRGGSGQLLLLGAGGRRAPLLQATEQAKCPSAGRPAWSPDSDQLAVPCVHANGRDRTLYVVDRQSGIPHPVLSSPDIRGGVAWTGDDRIVYPRVGPSGRGMSLWAVAADGSGAPRQLTHPRAGRVDFWPSWSERTDRLLFRRSDGAKKRGDMWTADADGGNPRDLTKPPGQLSGHVLAPAWSPDGTAPVCVTSGADGSWTLWRGTPPDTRRLFHSAVALGPPA
jgi:Tol biopolymer transport system component